MDWTSVQQPPYEGSRSAMGHNCGNAYSEHGITVGASGKHERYQEMHPPDNCTDFRPIRLTVTAHRENESAVSKIVAAWCSVE